MELYISSLVWCVVRVVGGPLYSLERSVPAISLYGNMSNRLSEGQINLPTKMHLDGTQGGSAEPGVRPAPLFGLWTLSFSRRLLGGP
jgi:hypothetical protein